MHRTALWALAPPSLVATRAKKGREAHEEDKVLADRDYKPYVDPNSGTIYDAILNKTDVSQINQKNYIVQVLYAKEVEKLCMSSGKLT